MLCYFHTDKPDRPGKPEVEDSDRDFITISWAAPRKDGGAPITGYNVERKDPRTGRWNKINRSPITVRIANSQSLIDYYAIQFSLFPAHLDIPYNTNNYNVHIMYRKRGGLKTVLMNVRPHTVTVVNYQQNYHWLWDWTCIFNSKSRKYIIIIMAEMAVV